MIETAILTIRGERFLFCSAAHLLGQSPEADCEVQPAGSNLTGSPTALKTLPVAVAPAREVGVCPPLKGAGPACFFNLPHDGSNAEKAQQGHVRHSC